MRNFEIKPELYKKLVKISKKDKKTYSFVLKKIDEIVNSENPGHYKNLRHDMKYSKRVHIGHFVLIFSFDDKFDFISFEDFDHHDVIYK